MNRLIGFRKIIMLAMVLFTFACILFVLGLREAAAIVAVGTTLIGIVSVTVYGNVKEHEHKKDDDNAPV